MNTTLYFCRGFSICKTQPKKGSHGFKRKQRRHSFQPWHVPVMESSIFQGYKCLLLGGVGCVCERPHGGTKRVAWTVVKLSNHNSNTCFCTADPQMGIMNLPSKLGALCTHLDVKSIVLIGRGHLFTRVAALINVFGFSEDYRTLLEFFWNKQQKVKPVLYPKTKKDLHYFQASSLFY